ncbi:MAG: hypothetical protein RIF33_21125 [Cyclobacteriaceae bacterium]
MNTLWSRLKFSHIQLKLFLAIGIFFTIHLAALSQPYLYLNQIGRRGNYKYFEKETIRFKLKGDDTFSIGLISGFGDNYIRFSQNIISLDSIEMIDIRDKKRALSFPATVTRLAAYGGYAYALIDWFNVSVVDGNDASLNGGVLLGATGLLGLSYGLKAIQRKYFRVGRGNSLTIITTPNTY